jgi:hypothetical protein
MFDSTVKAKPTWKGNWVISRSYPSSMVNVTSFISLISLITIA